MQPLPFLPTSALIGSHGSKVSLSMMFSFADDFEGAASAEQIAIWTTLLIQLTQEAIELAEKSKDNG